jgi:hypothetical protein
MIDFVRGKAGLYPELKSPPLYTARGVDMEKIFVDLVKKKRPRAGGVAEGDAGHHPVVRLGYR